jgi:hypothetical protein
MFRVPIALSVGVLISSLSSPAALAQPPPARPGSGPDEPAQAGSEVGAATPAKKPDPEWELEVGGRLFVRDTFTRIETSGDELLTHARAIDLARLFFTYDRKRLRVAFEIDFADGDADLKDTYIRLQPAEALRVQVGRFKVPMSFLGLTSRWSLPSTERGILSELDVQDRDLPFAGARGDGISLDLRPRLPLDPRFTLGAFQNHLASSATPLDPRDELTQDVYGRVSLEPIAGLKVATALALVGYQEQLGVVDSHAEFPMASLETEIDTEHVRLWAEAFLGESFFPQPDGSVTGQFAAGRLLVAGRFQVPLFDLWRIEPFAGGSVLDPTNDVSNEHVTELAGGVNLAFSKHWRIQIEVDRRLAGGAAAPLADGTLVRLQLGATFAETVAAALQPGS